MVFFSFATDSRWDAELDAVEFGIGVAKARGVDEQPEVSPGLN